MPRLAVFPDRREEEVLNQKSLFLQGLRTEGHLHRGGREADVGVPLPSTQSDVRELQRQISELVRGRDLLRQFSNDIPDLTKVPQCQRSSRIWKDGAATATAGCETLEVRGRAIDGEDRHIVEARCSVVGIHDSRRADGGEVQIYGDVFIDRRSGCEAQMSRCMMPQSHQSNVRNAQCGCKGVRVGEASHPGPPHTTVLQMRCWTVSSSR